MCSRHGGVLFFIHVHSLARYPLYDTHTHRHNTVSHTCMYAVRPVLCEFLFSKGYDDGRSVRLLV